MIDLARRLIYQNDPWDKTKKINIDIAMKEFALKMKESVVPASSFGFFASARGKD